MGREGVAGVDLAVLTKQLILFAILWALFPAMALRGRSGPAPYL